MINHALFGSLLHTEATPVTDDLFHRAVLHYKLARAGQLPTIAPVLDDRRRARRLTTDQLARTALEDDELRLPGNAARGSPCRPFSTTVTRTPTSWRRRAHD